MVLWLYCNVLFVGRGCHIYNETKMRQKSTVRTCRYMKGGFVLIGALEAAAGGLLGSGIFAAQQ